MQCLVRHPIHVMRLFGRPSRISHIFLREGGPRFLGRFSFSVTCSTVDTSSRQSVLYFTHVLRAGLFRHRKWYGPLKGSKLLPVCRHRKCYGLLKGDNSWAGRHSLNDGITGVTDVLVGGKRALACGYVDVGKGCALALCGLVLCVRCRM